MGPMATQAPIPPLHGREVEFRALSDAFDRVAAGHLTIVIVEGEAGIGKSRLLVEALSDARVRGFEVVTGRARELEGTRPFGVLADIFAGAGSSSDPRRAAIAALLATHNGDRAPLTVSSDPGLQFQAVDAFVDLIESLALQRPLVVAVDDLQWADPSTLLTLATLGGRLADVPLALLGCLRLLPRGPELQRVLEAMEAGGARRLPLGPLGDDAVGELVAEVVAAEPGHRLLAEVAGAGGNPLFVTELVGALLAEGAIQVADGRAEVAQVTLPPTLRLTILRRLSLLPDDTLEALQAASILGASFTLAELSTTTGQSALELSSVLGEALRARVLEDDGDRLRFRHDLLHEALYEDLPASVRLGLHREAGQRLARSGALALQVAEQLARGAMPGDTEAIDWLTRAAREAAPSSPGVAAELLERAAGLTDPADPSRDRLLAEQAGALMLAGRLADAEATCHALLDRDHDPSVQAPTRILLARTLATQGRLRDTLRELERVQESPTLTDELRASAEAAEAMARLQLGDLAGAVTAAERARGAAALPGDHPASILAITSLAIVEELRANLGRALRLIDEAVRLADQSPHRRGHQEVVHLARANILMGLDRLPEARSTLETGQRISEQLGVRWRLPLYQAVIGMERFLAGQWDDAMAESQAALALAEETGERHSLVLTHSVASLIALHRGELRHAEEAAVRAEGELADTGPRFRSHWAMWARALLLEAGGATREALATMTGCWKLCARSGFAIEYPVLGADLVRLALGAGDQDRAARVAAAVAEVAARNDVHLLTGAALRCRGLAEDDPGMLRAAVDAYTRGARPLELAFACEDAGAALARQGEGATAAPLLDKALAGYERLDAAHHTARVEARLRELGIRRGRRGPRQRPQFGWDSLTPTEHRVVDLVAEGLTNPQIGERLFVSRRTVQTHLAHVFAKLGISSRTQVAAEATRRRQAPLTPRRPGAQPRS
jgi:DNA-binding CsgD family transcriptional regulator